MKKRGSYLKRLKSMHEDGRSIGYENVSHIRGTKFRSSNTVSNFVSSLVIMQCGTYNN